MRVACGVFARGTGTPRWRHARQFVFFLATFSALFIVRRTTRARPLKTAIVGTLWLGATLVGHSRVYLRYHSPAQVM